MDIPDRIFQWNQTFLPEDIVRKGFLDIRDGEIDSLRHQLVHHFACHATVPELVGGVIHASQHPGEILSPIGGRVVYLRMYHIHLAVEYRRLAEKKEGGTWFQTVVSILDSLKENQFHLPAGIPHKNAEALFGTFAREFGGDHLGKDLDERAAGLDISDELDGTAIDIAERIGAQEVSDSLDLKLSPEQRGPFRPHPRQVLHLCI